MCPDAVRERWPAGSGHLYARGLPVDEGVHGGWRSGCATTPSSSPTSGATPTAVTTRASSSWTSSRRWPGAAWRLSPPTTSPRPPSGQRAAPLRRRRQQRRLQRLRRARRCRHGHEPLQRRTPHHGIARQPLRPATTIVSYTRWARTGGSAPAIRKLALEARPKDPHRRFSAYPWDIDWAEFRKIADEAGAILLADIAHTAGLVSAGVVRSPSDTPTSSPSPPTSRSAGPAAPVCSRPSGS